MPQYRKYFAYIQVNDTLRNRLPFYLSFLLLFIPFYLSAQAVSNADIAEMLEQANTYGEAANYEAGDQLLQKALELIQRHDPQNDSLLGLTHFMISKTKMLNGEWAATPPNMRKAIYYYRKAYGTLSMQTADAIYSLGRIHFEVFEDVDSSLHYYREALDLYEQMDKKLDIGWSYRAMASIQAFAKDYAGALSHCELAVEYLGAYRSETEEKGEKISRSYYLQMGQAYLQMAELYASINDEEKSVLYAQRAWQLVEEQEDLHQLMRYYVLHNQAQFHAHRGDYKQAIGNYQTLLHESEGEDAPSERREVYTEMARLHRHLAEYKTALKYHQMVLDLNTVIKAPDSLHYAPTYLEMAKLYRLEGQYEKAQGYANHAYRISQKENSQRRLSEACAEKALLLDHQGQYSAAATWMEQAFTPSYPPPRSPETAQLLSHQALIYWHQYQQNGKMAPLQQAQLLIEQSLELIEVFTEETFKRRDFISQQLSITDLALQIKHALYKEIKDQEYLEKAFALSEAAKVNTLRLTLRENQGVKKAKIPAGIIAEEKALKGKLAVYRQRLHYISQRNNETATEKHQWQDSVFATGTRLQALKQALENDYPDYFRLKYDNSSISIAAIQRQLPQDAALIEYFIGDKNAFLFLVTLETADFIPIPNSTEWSAELALFRQQLAPKNQDYATKNLVRTSHNLYQKLLAPAITQLDTSITTLLIVPDGMLNMLPFEVLLTEAVTSPTHGQLPYLLRDYTVSYAYSATWLWPNSKRKRTAAKHQLGAFAANYDQYTIDQKDTLLAAVFQNVVRSGFLPLLGAEKEVQQIASLFSTTPFLKEQATKEQFENSASDFQILHLAMHALIEENAPQFSKLLFTQAETGQQNGQLSAQELYNYDLNAELVVLSACNTGIGKMKRGEGLISLSHAFALAGVPATVMSLWKIPDQTTPELMLNFYQHLKTGVSKNEALRQAKLQYLDEVKMDQLAHPYFWSGFMLMGDTSPIQTSAVPYWLLLGVVLLALGAISWRFWFKKA